MSQELHYPAWMQQLTQRERDEIELARFYVANLRHGTDGHHRLFLIAHLAHLLDRATNDSDERISTWADFGTS